MDTKGNESKGNERYGVRIGFSLERIDGWGKLDDTMGSAKKVASRGAANKMKKQLRFI